MHAPLPPATTGADALHTPFHPAGQAGGSRYTCTGLAGLRQDLRDVAAAAPRPFDPAGLTANGDGGPDSLLAWEWLDDHPEPAPGHYADFPLCGDFRTMGHCAQKPLPGPDPRVVHSRFHCAASTP